MLLFFLFAIIFMVSSANGQAGIFVSQCRKSSSNFDKYWRSVRGLKTGNHWKSDDIITLPMHFISVQAGNLAPVSAEDSFKLGSALNSVFRFAGIQFDYSYELLTESNIPSEFRKNDPADINDKTLAKWIEENVEHLRKMPAMKTIFLRGVGGGWGRMISGPRDFFDGLQMVRVRQAPEYAIKVLIHETAHVLGLDHVFTNYCDGDREFKSTWEHGDQIEDTGAVPYNAVQSCSLADSFTPAFKECDGDRLPVLQAYSEADEEALGNWMNYGWCPNERGHFTPGQVAVMRCVADFVYETIQLDESGDLPNSDLRPTPSEDAWQLPRRDSLYDAGGELELAFNFALHDAGLIRKNKRSSETVKLALVPLATAQGLRRDSNGDPVVRASWLDPYLIFEGRLRGDNRNVARVPLQYKSGRSLGGRVPFVTKGRYVLAMEAEAAADEVVGGQSLFFSPPFSVGYRTCQAENVADADNVHGVCRPLAECEGRQNGVADRNSDDCSGDTWAADTSMVCCVIVGRDLQDPLGDTFNDAHDRPVAVQLPNLPVLGQRIDAIPFLLQASGSAFLGAPYILDFDVTAIKPVPVVSFNSNPSVFDLVWKSPVYESGTRISYQNSPQGLLDLCAQYQIERECFGVADDEPLPVSQLRVLELRPFGTGASASPVDLLALAREQNGDVGEANRDALDKPTGRLSVILPENLPERMYYIHMVAGVGTNEGDRQSAPFELNYAPCSKAVDQGGSCRLAADCEQAGFQTSDDGCPGFSSGIRCCLGDPLAVFGSYRTDSRAGAAAAAAASGDIIVLPDSGAGGEETDGSIDNTTLLLAVGGSLCAVLLGGLALAVALAVRRSSSKSSSSSRGSTQRRVTITSSHRRSTRRGSAAPNRQSYSNRVSAGNVPLKNIVAADALQNSLRMSNYGRMSSQGSRQSLRSENGSHRQMPSFV